VPILGGYSKALPPSPPTRSESAGTSGLFQPEQVVFFSRTTQPHRRSAYVERNRKKIEPPERSEEFASKGLSFGYSGSRQ